MQVVPLSCLERFTLRDYEFLEAVLGASPLASVRTPDRDWLGSLLGEPEIFETVTASVHPLPISPELYFFVLVGRALTDAGINELEVIDYVAATLARHGGDSEGTPVLRPESDFTYHVDFVEALEGLGGYDRFFLQVRCGNQFLVMTGLFPAFFEHRATRRGAPGLPYYEGVARDAFRAAADHPLADEFRLGGIYPRLAECIPQTRAALNRMAEEYLFLDN